MSKNAGNRPIIIKKKKRGGHGGHHGGAWKVAYADFVTAMMAFFLVMWILGLSETTRKAIAGYFKEPGVFSFTTGKALPEQIEVVHKAEDGDGDSKKKKDDSTQMIDISLDGKCPKGGPGEAETARMNELESEVKRELAELARMRPDLAALVGSITVEITDEGLRIEMSEVKDAAFFDVGTAIPNRAARDVLAALGPKLAQLGNQIDIEGHTDARTFPRGAQYTNWELSADRANAARKILLDNGVTSQQIAEVTGYADRKLRKPDAPHDVMNRRVSIVVKYREDEPGTKAADAAAPGGTALPAGTPLPTGTALPSAPGAAAAPAATAEADAARPPAPKELTDLPRPLPF